MKQVGIIGLALILGAALLVGAQMQDGAASGGKSADNIGAWKTTTDALHPSELKRSLEDPDAHLHRYQVALADGRAPEVDLSRRKVVRFVDPARNPELVQAWKALYFLSAIIEGADSPEYRDAIQAALSDSGVTKNGVNLVLAGCDEYQKKLKREAAENMHILNGFAELYRTMSLENPGKKVDDLFERAAQAARKGNLQAIASMLKISESEAAEFARVHTAEVDKLAGIALVNEFEATLTPNDWVSLRKFLYEWVKQSLGIMMETELR